MVDHLNVSYLYKKRGVYYFSKRAPCDVRSAEKSVRVRNRDTEDLVGYILNEMEEFSDWTARNPL